MRTDASPGDRVITTDGRKGTILSRGYQFMTPGYNIALDTGPERIFSAASLVEESPLETLALLARELYGSDL